MKSKIAHLPWAAVIGVTLDWPVSVRVIIEFMDLHHIVSLAARSCFVLSFLLVQLN